jgi:hypothetical protein
MPPLVQGRDAFAEAQRLLRLARLLNPGPQPERWFVEIQGSCVKFRKTGGPETPIPPAGRNEVGQFSKASRLRLLSYMNRIDWQKFPAPLFVTLTYPDTILHRDYSTRSRDRFLFLRYVEKHLQEKTPSIWRVEWKPRKSGEFKGRLMPHWHLLFPLLTGLNENSVREWWRKSIEHDESYLDVDCRQVVGELAAVKYLAKYVSKQQALGILAYHNSGFRFGRHWGITRKSLIPMAPITVCRELTEDEIVAVNQYAHVIWPGWERDLPTGYTLLNPKEAKQWKEFLD